MGDKQGETIPSPLGLPCSTKTNMNTIFYVLAGIAITLSIISIVITLKNRGK